MIDPNKKALEEIVRLWDVSINNNPTPWDNDASDEVTKISFLNTQAIQNIIVCIKLDLNLHQSDVIILAETWVAQNEEE